MISACKPSELKESYDIRKSIDDIRVIFQLVNACINKITVSDNKYFNLFLTVLLMAPFNLMGELLAKKTLISTWTT